MDDATTILVIEDDDILRENMAYYLGDCGFRAMTAENGRIGLEVFESERPDLILTDLRMPEVDGLDVLRRIGEVSPETPMIVVSGTGRISDSIQALRLGAWDYILKPIEDMSIIALAIDKALERHWLRRENREYQEHLEARTQELRITNQALETSLDTLQKMQEQLIQTEKMASLGRLVAGVAHELNTPIGIGVMAASYLEQQTHDIEALYREDTMKRSDLDHYIETAAESTRMILENLHRAAEQIQSFKHVAVDQSSTEQRTFSLKTYINEVLLSLSPKLKNTGHTVIVSCAKELELNSYPGAFSHILTNVVMNSLYHGFRNIEHGEIVIEALCEDDMLHLRYHDNGKGIAAEGLPRIFDPFYTTTRGQGGTGLGLHIVYNLVTQRLRGHIHCESAEGKGTTFYITIPCIADQKGTR